MEAEEIQIATMVCVKRDGKVLMVRGTKPHAPHYGLHNMPGGKLEPSDQGNLNICAVREVKEETGIDVEEGKLELLGMVEFRGQKKPGSVWRVYIFYTEQSSGNITHPDALWVVESDFGNITLIPGNEIIFSYILRRRQFDAIVEYKDGRYLRHLISEKPVL